MVEQQPFSRARLSSSAAAGAGSRKRSIVEVAEATFDKNTIVLTVK
jgi:hypothetical protein